MKIALVHDWLTGLRGGERCLQRFLTLYPQADVFSLVHIPGRTTPLIDQHVRETSFLNSIPYIEKVYRHCLPLYPMAVRGFDFKGYDLVISLSHAAAKNITVNKGIPHISYCFTPMRYIWDQRKFYFGSCTPLLEPLFTLLRRWDVQKSVGVNHFVGISSFVKARIRCFYKRDASVLYPPVDTQWIKAATGPSRGSFLYAGALVPYKRPDLVVQAFNELGLPLTVVGTGPELKKLQAVARKNITFEGHVEDQELAGLYRSSRALIFPGTEDFGMIPVECMAAGRPVIGLYHGGLKDTINGLKSWEKFPTPVTRPTGVFFRKSTDRVGALKAGVRFFLDREEIFNPSWCVAKAGEFSPEVFDAGWNQIVAQTVSPKFCS